MSFACDFDEPTVYPPTFSQVNYNVNNTISFNFYISLYILHIKFITDETTNLSQKNNIDNPG
jgi:hypothetical protein